MSVLQSFFYSKILRTISRIIIGITFIFSGFVKLVDPLGSMYKFIDYFNAFDIGFLEPLALPAAIILSTAEFIFGVGLAFNIKPRFNVWGVFVFMAVFTPLTLYIAFTNPVSDCGCFGDAIIMSNWETFWKNIILDVFLVIAVINRKRFTPVLPAKSATRIFGSVIILSLGFGIYSSNYLPVLDFRPYSAGTYIPQKMKIPEGKEETKYGYDYTLKNSESGEKKVMSSQKYMDEKIWKDSTWNIIKTSDPYVVKEGYTPPIHDLQMVSNEPQERTGIPKGEDILDTVLSEPGYSFWLVAYNLNKSDMEAMKYANTIATFAHENNWNFYCMTASGQGDIDTIREKIDPPYNFFNTDPITLKTIVRANPGYVLLKKGKILEKWHNNNPPEIEELKEKYLKSEN